MKNEQINDFLREAYAVFKKYSNRRPVKDEKDEAEMFDAFSEVTEKHGIYDRNGDAKNAWIYDFVYKGLMRELMKKEADD